MHAVNNRRAAAPAAAHGRKAAYPVSPLAVQKVIARQSFCTLATASRRNRPHVVGVFYCAVAGSLYVATGESTRKARDVRDNPHVAVCIPVRRYPVGPPFCVQFSGCAEIVAASDPSIADHLRTGALKRITGFGTLAEPDLCFIRIVPDATVWTYGVGVPVLKLLRDPIHASGRARLVSAASAQ